MANPSTKESDLAWDDPAFGEAASNESGTRRVTHEIDREFGLVRSPPANVGVEACLAPVAKHVPTLPAPTVFAPIVRTRKGHAARPTLPGRLETWPTDSRRKPLSESSWLGASVRALAESRPEASEDEDDVPSLSVADLATVEAEDEELSIDVEESSLDLEELEAIDASDLAPLRAHFERGDYFGVLLCGEALLEQRPEMKAALHYVGVARDSLVRRYLSDLGGFRQVPHSLRRADEIMSLSLDHREAFLLSLVDGVSTIEEIVDMSGVPELDALRLLSQLAARGLVVCGTRR